MKEKARSEREKKEKHEHDETREGEEGCTHTQPMDSRRAPMKGRPERAKSPPASSFVALFVNSFIELASSASAPRA